MPADHRPAGDLAYQAFRWWGIGTSGTRTRRIVGAYRAFRWWGIGTTLWRCWMRHEVAAALPASAFTELLPLKRGVQPESGQTMLSRVQPVSPERWWSRLSDFLTREGSWLREEKI